jgi:hypothetical protein
MTRTGLPAVTMIVLVALGVQADAKAPCEEYLRLRNAATDAWKAAMGAPSPQRCGAFDRASLAAEATLNYVNSNREACDISVPLLSQVEDTRRQAVQTRDNACAGRPLLTYPADIIRQ